MNPKHEVPIFDHDGQIVTESRGIAKYFHENFNQDLEKNDHWYPKDPEERAKVRSVWYLIITWIHEFLIQIFHEYHYFDNKNWRKFGKIQNSRLGFCKWVSS